MNTSFTRSSGNSASFLAPSSCFMARIVVLSSCAVCQHVSVHAISFAICFASISAWALAAAATSRFFLLSDTLSPPSLSSASTLDDCFDFFAHRRHRRCPHLLTKTSLLFCCGFSFLLSSLLLPDRALVSRHRCHRCRPRRWNPFSTSRPSHCS